MEKLRLLIAEGSEAFRNTLADMLRETYQVRCCAEGNEARALLRQFEPDVLVLDLMLPGYDGISLLQWMAGQELRPQVLAVSSYVTDYVVEAAVRMGASYVIRKPCDLGAMTARIADLSRRRDMQRVSLPDGQTQAANLLLRLGIRTKLRGYTYLRLGIMLMVQDPTQSITKMLYPTIAKRCGCAPMHVERSIRSAIHTAWAHRDDNLWRLYFGTDDTGTIPRPTNGEFLTRLADIVRSHREEMYPDDAEYVQNIKANG